MRILLLPLALILTVVGCDMPDPQDAAKDSTAAAAAGNRPAPVVYAPQSDSLMNAAVLRAKAELGFFESIAKSPLPTQTGLGVKVAIPHAGGEEHLWLGSPIFEADSVVGRVEDEPLYVKTLKRGELVRVDKDAVTDWMYLDSNRLRGGYTIRVAIERLPEDQKQEQRKAFGIE
jgi:uncharacterized protein YegJ (DUF2314 family)